MVLVVVVVLKVQNLGEPTQTVDFPKSDGESFENFRYGFGTPKGHTFNSENPRDILVILVDTWSTSLDLIVATNV